MARVVLVTGVSRPLGARLGRTLAAAEGVSVVGVDVAPPSEDLGRVSFVRADIRNPVIAKVLAAHQVNTVVHLAPVSAPVGPGGRTATKETNVIGTMQLLAACQQSDSVSRLVVQSSASVYGASPGDPARFTEDMEPRSQPRAGGKDSVEIEGYVRGLARRRPDVVVTILRLASLMGAQVDSPLVRYLSLPVVPKVLGFDARLQLLHPADAVAALLRAARREVPGTFNVGAADIVTMTQALRMAGRPAIGVPRSLAPALAGTLRQAGLSGFSPDQIDELTYGRVMDVSSFTRATGFHPRFSSRAALQDFLATTPPGPLSAERLEPLLDVVERRLTGGVRADG